MCGITKLGTAQEYLPVTPVPNSDLCPPNRFSVDQEPEFEEFISQVDQGGGLYTHYYIESANEQIGWNTYRVDSTSQPIQLGFQLYTPEIEAATYRYMVLIDGEQIEFKVNNAEETTSWFDVVLNQETGIAEYNFELPTLELGVHTVYVINLQKFDQSPQPTGTRSSSNLRYTFIVGDDIGDFPYTNSQFNELPASGLVSQGAVSQGLVLTLDDTTTQWSFPDQAHQISSGTALMFDALISYVAPSNLNDGSLPLPATSVFGLAVFLDGEQIAFADGQRILYGEVTQDTAYTRIPIQLPPIEIPGLHEVLVLRIDNPGVPTCVLFGTVGGYQFSENVEHVRATLDVVS